MDTTSTPTLKKTIIKPAIGFVRVGWIGLNSMNALLKEDIIHVDAQPDSSHKSGRSRRSHL